MAREIFGWIPGSARSVWRAVAAALMNERGEAGDQPAEGEGQEQMSEGWDDPNKVPSGEAEGSEEVSGQEPAVEEGGEEKPEGEAAGEEAGEEKPEDELAKLRSERDMYRKQAEFYQTQYNEALGEGEEEEEGEEEARPAKPAAKPAAPGELPEGIKGPEEWESQSEQAQYLDYRATQLANQTVDEQVTPVLRKVDKVLSALQEAIVKVIHPDYDEIVKTAIEDTFVLDPSGTIAGVKNDGLLRYFRAQPFPQLAMYEHALSRLAPKKIKEGTQKATAQALKKIVEKPKGPKQPKGGTAPGKPADLTWDTPPKERDRILKERGLLE